MPIYALGDAAPTIDPTAYVHPDAVVIGAVTLGPEASVWPGAVLRADHGAIDIGARTSIQDGTVVHTTVEWHTVVGDECVIGHNVHLEGCVIEPWCLVGSGSVVLNRVTVRTGALVGAGALVPEDTEVPSGHVALGVPARCRPMPKEQIDRLVGFGVKDYIETGALFRSRLRRID